MRLATVTCTSGKCGQVVVRDVQLWICVSQPDRNHYTFKCSACGRDCMRQASDSEVLMIAGSGFETHHLSPIKRDPLDVDELIDLAQAIEMYEKEGEPL